MKSSTPVSVQRRQFLQALAGTSLAGWAGLASHSSHAATADQAWRSSYAPFDSAPGSNPTATTLQTERLTLIGRPPKALRGNFYRIGPARFVRAENRLNHWFDGDGMVQLFRIDGAQVSHLGHLLDTPKSHQEQQAKRFLYNGFGSQLQSALAMRQPDDVNVANINVLPMNGGRSLYALWEAGSALQIDPSDLSTIGFKKWSIETAAAPFGAHPRMASDGSVWNCGALVGSGKLLIYHLSPNGELLHQKLLDAPQADMVHDFAITDRYLVFLLQPLKADRGQLATSGSVLAAMHWDPQAPLLACIVSQADFSVRWVDLPNTGVFHLGNAWEHGNDIRLGYVAHNNFLQLLRSFDIENMHRSDRMSRWVELELNTQTGTAKQIETGLTDIEFPRYDLRRTGKHTQFNIHLARGQSLQQHTLHGFNRVQVLRAEQIQGFDYGPGWLAEEHIYVPHPERSDEGSGWVLGTAYHWPTERSVLSVFAVANVADGPLAQWHLPYGLPLGLHGQFVGT